MIYCGIYKITSPSGKVYIGQSKNIKKRWTSYNGTGALRQPKLYNSFKKYKIENHDFEICHELPKDIAQEILNNYEILYWEFYKELGFKMLNLAKPGNPGNIPKKSRIKVNANRVGVRRPKYVIEKMSANRKGKYVGERNHFYGRKFTEEDKKRMSNLNGLKKSVIQLTLNGEFVKEWESARQAQLKGGFSQCNIGYCCKNKQESSKGFKWKYKDE